jgi:hypothetical protein
MSPVTNGGNISQVAGAASAPLLNNGAPVNGTDEVQTLTIGGTPGAGFIFKFTYAGVDSIPIPWSATNATLLANIQAALNAHPNIGVNGMVASAGTVAAGIGTVLLTAGARLTKLAIATLTFSVVTSVGTAPTVSNVETTPGVTATGRGAARGRQLINTATGDPYKNTSAVPEAPVWALV